MIVVDASALLAALLRPAESRQIRARLFEAGESLHAPHLIDLECTQTLRRFVSVGDIDAARARQALTVLMTLPMRRYPHLTLLSRIWALRSNMTAYDAAYVALAEALEAPLLTRDARLAAAAGSHTRVEVI